MFCRNCGNQMANEAAICVSCGVPVGRGNNYCPNCAEATNPNAQVCIKCGMGVNMNSGFGEAQKSKLVAGLLGIFLGSLGIHRFYLGYTGIGIIQIAVSIVTCGIGSLWGFIEGILILAGSSITKDAKGNPLKD